VSEKTANELVIEQAGAQPLRLRLDPSAQLAEDIAVGSDVTARYRTENGQMILESVEKAPTPTP
jgi:hypothetical protein